MEDFVLSAVYKPNEIPKWDFSKLEEVTIIGAENDDYLLYRYK